MSVRDIDRGAQELSRRVFGLRKPSVSVGILAADGAKPHPGGKSPLTILEIAVWNEFGLGVPERSFIRAWFDQNRDRATQMLAASLRQVVAGRYTAEVALHRLAQQFVAEIQARISAGIDPPNAASTVAKKGSATPLIDEGLLRSSISYSIDLRGTEAK